MTVDQTYHEAKDPKDQSDCFRTDVFDRANIDCLTVISEPIPKIDAFDIKLGEFLAACGSGHENIE